MTKADIAALNKRSTSLGSSLYDRCLDAGLNLLGFRVIAASLRDQIVGGCRVAHLPSHVQAKLCLGA